MSLSYFPPILFGLVVDLIVFGAACSVNYYIKITPNVIPLVIGIIGLSTVFNALIYLLVWRWAPVRTWTFYLVVVPLFAMSALDLSITFDTWNKPNHWILPEFLNLKDKLLESHFFILAGSLDGTLLHFLNYIVLWRAWNVFSWRSLLIFNATALATMYFVFASLVVLTWPNVHPVTLGIVPTIPMCLIFPLVALNLQRNFTLEKSETSICVRIFDFLTALGLIASVLLLVAKFLTIQGSSLPPTDLIRTNDPMLLFEDTLKGSIPASVGVLLLVMHLSFIVPSFAVNLCYKFQSRKPAFLWELTLVQFAAIVMLQYYHIAGALFWETPVESRVSVTNSTFWLINGLPVVASGLDLISLIPYKVKAVKSMSDYENYTSTKSN